ncbi:MAG: multidrug ABC transporter ATP-binding protein, partial [Alphaproteobacteria bacterium]
DGPPAAIKAKVAGTTIRIRTALSLAHLQMLPGVAKVDQHSADTSILTTNARATLESLFAADPALTEFEVASASLEDALANIIANTVKEAA